VRAVSQVKLVVTHLRSCAHLVFRLV
jgi:hypothetical protein